ncbi:poly(A) polymerase [Commensalibacter intestini]|uniref:Poly(A) polymerase n=1 Tax=Commensalibacter intestini TaxID=479936 RepID=A0A251ZUI3_9PROT|nr:CCA tRNA nucleotidyltransferase [Commensalibacter intestini]OUI78335.1 poly(A) polymerase [Commensalibacter intestini]
MSILKKLSCINALNQLWDYLPQARLVGGVVRDLLANKPIADIDIATPEPPETVMAILQKTGITVIPTGLAHGTVTALIDHTPYEITTLRKDIVTDGRHAQVVWTDDWQEDAARRDFTINAMFCDRDGKVWDFYQGQQDLLSGTVRFVGNAKERIEEDVLRSLRFFRFYARYGKEPIDIEAVTAIQQTTDLLKTLSAERVWSEMQRILIGPMADGIVQQMDQYGVLEEVLSFGYQLPFFQKMVQLGAPKDAVLRLAGLVSAPSQIVAKKLRLSRKQEKLLWAFQEGSDVALANTEIQKRQLRAEYDLEVLIGQSWIKQTASVIEDSEQWNQWRHSVSLIERPIFPVMGQDLIQLGVQPGPIIGNTLKIIKDWWLKNGCYASQEECLKWFKGHKNERIN